MSFLKDFQTEVKVLLGMLVVVALIIGGVFLFFSNSQQQTEQIPQDVTLSERETLEEISVVEDSGVIQFSGEALRGETFEKEINSNLVFRLVPRGQGWDISVGNKKNPDLTFTLITPPLRGINSTHVYGWHFRNSDNSGPNVIGPKSINAPGKEREFFFVLNEEDYDRALDILDILTHAYYTTEEYQAAYQEHEEFQRGTGLLTITDMELGNLEPNEQAWFERIKFDVELTLPTESLDAIKNAEYYVITYDETVQLKDGFYRESYPNSASGLEINLYKDLVAYGNVDNDSTNESVVILNSTGGGSGSFRELVVMKDDDGTPRYLTGIELGDRVIINSISISSGLIMLDMVVHGDDGGLCCPYVPERQTYKLVDDKLTFASGKILLSEKDVEFDGNAKGKIILSSNSASASIVKKEEIYCGTPLSGKERYEGDFLLEFQNKKIELENMMFVEDTAHDGTLILKKLNPKSDEDFIIVTQYGSCNTESLSFYGYDKEQKDLVKYSFVRQDGFQDSWVLAAGGEFEVLLSKEFITSYYDNSIGEIRLTQWRFDDINNVFNEVKAWTEPL